MRPSHFLSLVLAAGCGERRHPPAPPTEGPATDADGDGHVASAAGGDDCDDAAEEVHPGAVEVCGGVDEDCDGLVDDDDPDVVGAPTWYRDRDGDGFGLDRLTTTGCEQPEQPEGWAAVGGDCDDWFADRSPGRPEVCASQADARGDEDCDGLVDDDDPSVDPAGFGSWYRDADGDRYGSTVVSACARPEDATGVDGDCDDADPLVRGAIDQVSDPDGDGRGSGAVVTSCAPLAGSVPAWRGLDCAEGDPSVHPGAPDPCGDGVDQDCDGSDACHPLRTGDVRADDLEGRVRGSANAPLRAALDLSPDVTGDGQDDLVLDDGTGLRILSGAVYGTVDAARADVARVESTGGLVPLGTGDLDGDGFGDLLIGAPLHDLVAWFRGPLRGTWAIGDADAIVTARPDEWEFGASLALGDATGDGVGDVLVGDPSDSTNRVSHGTVWLLPGLPVDGEVASLALASIESADRDRLGKDVELVDLDGDGALDLVASAPDANVDPRVIVVRGPVSGALASADADLTFRAPDPGTWVGWSTASLGDWDGDGLPDLALGSSLRDDLAWVVSGAADGDQLVAPGLAVITGPASFGEAVEAAGDLDGDGHADLFVGAPSAPELDQGRAYAFLGGRSGQLEASEDAVVTVRHENGERGGFVSRSGDLDGDGSRDWLVGAEGVVVGGAVRGAVDVVYGPSP